ncbi:MAG TPA: ferrous iron transporter B, partial [Candidatus Binatia bacterium]|nr:ferrous iron transporter B [Candidatus Binatia bacterium]
MSATPATPVISTDHPQHHHAFTLALVGNPNAGKTTLFNALTGLRAKTANFPGTTVERKVGRMYLPRQIVVVDLPGLYSLDSKSPDEKLASDALQGKLEHHPAPNAALVVVDATNLERNLFLVSQILELKCPVIVALNMMDMARRDGIHIDIAKLRAELGCVVVPVSARSGHGIDELKQELNRLVSGAMPESVNHCQPNCGNCTGCTFQARYEWTEQISTRVMDPAIIKRSVWTDKLDDYFTHPVTGVIVFHIVMLALFALIFWAAQIPMELIDHGFTAVGNWVSAHMPEGDLQSLLVNGVIAGVGGILVFLPQICILFFALSLLEDTGYLSRAAFVMDKIMRKLGLPGKAFVPLLSAHACAIPAIMSTRVIENPRDRLLTILITPLMTCSARIPVYAMVTALLFPHSPLKA